MATHSFHTVNVVGVSFQPGYPGTFHKLAQRAADRYPKCKLRREPDNPHDPNAIAVVVGRRKVGHLPRGTAEWLAPRLDAGEDITAVVADVEVFPDIPHAPSMKVTIITPIEE
jgi:hypothetical protein